MAQKKQLYIMVPNDLPQSMIFDMLEMRFDIKLFDDIHVGRQAVREAGNDPAEGYIVGVEFSILDSEGEPLDDDEGGAPKGIAVGEPYPPDAPKTEPVNG